MIRVGDATYPWHEGMTVSELLEMIADTEYCAVIRLNDRLVSKPHFKSILIPDNSEVVLIPMIAGG